MSPERIEQLRALAQSYLVDSSEKARVAGRLDETLDALVAMRERVEALIDGLCDCGDDGCDEAMWRVALGEVLGDG